MGELWKIELDNEHISQKNILSDFGHMTHQI